MHLFCKCEKVKTLWRNLKKWLYYSCFVELDLSDHSIILNDYKGPFPDMINTIVLVTKYYVYSQHMQKKELNFIGFIKCTEKYKRIEYIVAKRSKNIKKHNNKWHMYDT